MEILEDLSEEMKKSPARVIFSASTEILEDLSEGLKNRLAAVSYSGASTEILEQIEIRF